jgi:hypothetical protein
VWRRNLILYVCLVCIHIQSVPIVQGITIWWLQNDCTVICRWLMDCCCSHFLSPSRTSCPTSQIQNPILEITKFTEFVAPKNWSRTEVVEQSFSKSENYNIQLIYDNPSPRHIYLATSAMFMPIGWEDVDVSKFHQWYPGLIIS